MRLPWDGSSEYQGGAGFAKGAEHQYGGWDCTGARLLANSLPLKKLRITGKGAGVAERLTGEDLKKVVELERGILWNSRKTFYKDRSKEELLQLVGGWSPVVSERAAMTLAELNDNTILPQLIEMLKSPELTVRYGACRTIEKMRGRAASAVPALTALLDDKDMELRIRAALALNRIGDPARPAIPAILKLMTKSFPEDPREMTQRYIGAAMFWDGILSQSIEGVDRKLLLSAVEKFLKNEDARVREVVSTKVYAMLKLEELKPILPTILQAVEEKAPSGEMWGAGVRVAGLELLAKNHVKEGIPLLLKFCWEQPQWGSQSRTGELMKLWDAYGAHAKEAIPELEKFAEWCRTEKDFPEWAREEKRKHVEDAITRIEASTEKPELISVTLDQ